MHSQLDFYPNSRAFFFRGKGEKRTPDTFTSRVVCRSLTKVSVFHGFPIRMVFRFANERV